jgi:hypothetical protein
MYILPIRTEVTYKPIRLMHMEPNMEITEDMSRKWCCVGVGALSSCLESNFLL